MNTRDDIDATERIDLRPMNPSASSSPAVTGDRRGRTDVAADTALPIASWQTIVPNEEAWELGRWAEFTTTSGIGLGAGSNPHDSGPFHAAHLDHPSNHNDRLGSDGRDDTEEGRPALSLFPLDGNLSTVNAYEYRIRVDETTDVPADASERLAAVLRTRNEAAITHAGARTVVATDRLTTDVPGPYELGPGSPVTLRADDEVDNRRIDRLLAQAFSAAVNESTYVCGRRTQVLTREPAVTGPDGIFEACTAYAGRLDVRPNGEAFLGIDVGHRIRSRVTLDEYCERTNAAVADLIDGVVEHDPETDGVAGTGRLVGRADVRFTDPIAALGDRSVAELYETSGRVSDETLDHLRSQNPLLVEVEYDPWGHETALHVPQLLRVVPSVEDVERLAPGFHRDWIRATQLDPTERFRTATRFVSHLDPLDGAEARVEATPVGPTHSFEVNALADSTDLVFGGGRTADHPMAGLQQYGVNRRPSQFHVQYLVPDCNLEAFATFRTRLERQFTTIGCQPTAVSYAEYSIDDGIDYDTVAAAVESVDAVLAVLPRSDAPNGPGDDPTLAFETAFGTRAIPSQLIRIDELDDDRFVRPTALRLIAGAGGIPWRVAGVPGDVDCFVGLHAIPDPATDELLGVSVAAVRPDGTVFGSTAGPHRPGKPVDATTVGAVLSDVRNGYAHDTGDDVDDVVIHCDGHVFEDVDQLVEPLAEAGAAVDVLDVHRRGGPRAAVHADGRYQAAHKGHQFVSSGGEYGFLTTTGRPDTESAVPRTLRVERRAGETPLRTLIEQVYWLSESPVGYARQPRLPVTTAYAGRCGAYVREDAIVRGKLVRGIPYL